MDKNSKQITIRVMNREGHATHTVGFDDALDLIREEMGKGKWLRIVDEDGSSRIETSITTLTSDMDKLVDDLMNAQFLTLQAALQGGGPTIEEPTITINGKVYSLSQVKIKSNSEGKVTEVKTPDEPKVYTGVAMYNDPDDQTLLRVIRNDPDECEPEVEVVLNNAYGIEALARGIAHLARFLDIHWHHMRNGTMEVDDGE